MEQETKKEIRYIIIGTIIGFLVQLACRQYLKYRQKDNPEKSNKSNPSLSKPKKIASRKTLEIIKKLRGGFIDFASIAVIVSFLGDVGSILGPVGGFTVYLLKKKEGSVFSLFNEALPQNLPVKALLSLKETKSAVELLSDRNLDTLFNILNDQSIPFDQKNKATYRILTQHLDLQTNSGRVKFVLCLVAMLLLLSSVNTGGYFILLHQLAEAVRNGEISKAVYRLILRQLKRKGLRIDPDI